jgi:ABC-type transport system substrate-binding protein
MRKRSWIVAIAAPAMLAVAAFAGIALAGSANAATTRNFYVTLYGWPDNSPPGDGTAVAADGGPSASPAA